MHEQSETIERDGKYYNVYGRETPKAGEVLPGEPPYDTLEQAAAGAKKRSQQMNGKPASSVPEVLADRFPVVTAPLRGAWNAARLPIDIGADALRRGVHGALGLEEAEPWGSTGQTTANLVGALGDATMPVREGVRMGARAATGVGDWLRNFLTSQGARPAQTSAPVRPLKTGPGYLDAELAAGAPNTPESSARRVPRPMPSRGLPAQGALAESPITTDPQEMMEAGVSQNAAVGALDEGRTAAPPALRQSMAEQYRRKIAEIEKRTGRELTQQQKAELQLDFFLRMMQLGSRPGATLIGSAGEGGLATSALSRGMQERNAREAAEGRRESREDVFREIGFADKDEDNQARREQLGITRTHYANMDARDRQRLGMLGQQIAQGKWKVLDNGKTGTYVLFDATTGQSKDTGIKVARSERDTRPAEIQLLEHLRRNPQDLELLKSLRGKEKDDTDQIFDAAMNMVNEGAKTGIKTSVEDAVREARRGMDIVRGRAPQAPGVQKPATEAEAHRQAKEAKARGAPLDRINERLRQWGYRTVE